LIPDLIRLKKRANRHHSHIPYPFLTHDSYDSNRLSPAATWHNEAECRINC
jgi:hypothetical protein